LVLLVQVVLQVLTVKDGLELAEELEGILNVGDDLEVLVDVLLEGGLHRGYINVKFDEISVEGVVVEVQKLVVLFLEELNVVLEGLNNWVDVLEVVLLQGLELFNC